jgi:PKD repeat protein
MTEILKRMTWPLILLAIVLCMLMIAPATATPLPAIIDCTPDHAVANNDGVSLTLNSTGFTGTPTVWLAMAGQTNISAYYVQLDGTTISASFSLVHAAPGSWEVWASNGADPGVKWNGTFTIDPTPTLNVTGKVVDHFTGLPLSNAEIYNGNYGPSTVSQADGTFVIPDSWVFDGEVDLDAVVSGLYRDNDTRVSVTEDDLLRGSKDIGTIELYPIFAGYVTDKITGKPLPDAHVSLDVSSLEPVLASGVSNSQGYYVLQITYANSGSDNKLRDAAVDSRIPILYLNAEKDGYEPYSSEISLYSLDGEDLYNIQLTPIFTADFLASGHIGQAPFSVQFLDQSTGSPTIWRWDFGDGTTSTEQNPTHVYTRTGVYTVFLIAANDWATDMCTKSRSIVVNTVPVANFTANATSGSTPFAVQFTDQSTGAESYEWQFGDGTTSTEQNPVHTYTHPGTYSVTQVVSRGEYGSVFVEKPGYITVSNPSMIGFSSNVTAGPSPLAVQFTESTNGSVQYFFWQFGDGATSNESNPVHIYDSVGKYTVSLMAVGSNGTEVKTVENYINVTSPVTPTPTVTTTSTVTPTPTGALPVANFTVTPQDGAGSMGILVTDTSVNATSVRYDLGDGTTTAYPTFRYTYWQAGTYTIRQTATSAAGSSNKTISVIVPAVPVTTIPPIGGDQGWYTIHCNVDGATVIFDETTKGIIAGGILKIPVYVTASPYRTYTVQKDGYSTVSGAITDHPSKGENVDITVTLTPGSVTTPYNGPHNIPGTLQAEDYDLGGEGVAYHDTTAGNEGGIYRHDDVDIETLDTDRSPNIGWIRAGEWLTYTVNVNTAGTYDAGFRVASSHAGSSVQVYLDDGTTPIATVNVPNTGDWLTFQTVPVPVTLPAGQHRLSLLFPTDYVNINWISFPPKP